MKSLLTFLGICIICSSCEIMHVIKENKRDAETVVLTPLTEKQVVPFRLVDNRILVTVKVNGEDIIMQLDTGAPTILSEGYARKHNLIVDSTRQLVSTPLGLSETEKYIGRNVTLDINGVRVQKDYQKIMKMSTSVIACEHIDGLLGVDVLCQFTLIFDFEHKTMEMYAKDKLPEDIASYDKTIRFDNYSPAQKIPNMDLTLNGVKTEFIWDMGFNSNFYLRYKSAGKFHKLLNAYPGAVRYESTGVFKDVNGQSKKAETWYMDVSMVKQGDNVISTQGYRASAFLDEGTKMPHSNIGVGFMKQYKMVISWHTKKIYLKEVSAPARLATQHQVNVGYSEKDKAIEALLVAKSSDAYRQGLRAGDKVTYIGNKATSDIMAAHNNCDMQQAVQDEMKEAAELRVMINGKEQMVPLKN